MLHYCVIKQKQCSGTKRAEQKFKWMNVVLNPIQDLDKVRGRGWKKVKHTIRRNSSNFGKKNDYL